MKAFDLIPIILRNPDAYVYVEEDHTHDPTHDGSTVTKQVQYVSAPYQGLGARDLGGPPDPKDPQPGPKLIFHTKNDRGAAASGKMAIDQSDPERTIFGYVGSPVVTQITVPGKPRSFRTADVAEILLKAYRMLTGGFSAIRFHIFSGDVVDVEAERLTLTATPDDTTAELVYTSGAGVLSPYDGLARSSKQ